MIDKKNLKKKNDWKEFQSAFWRFGVQVKYARFYGMQIISIQKWPNSLARRFEHFHIQHQSICNELNAAISSKPAAVEMYA